MFICKNICKNKQEDGGSANHIVPQSAFYGHSRDAGKFPLYLISTKLVHNRLDGVLREHKHFNFSIASSVYFMALRRPTPYHAWLAWLPSSQLLWQRHPGNLADWLTGWHNKLVEKLLCCFSNLNCKSQIWLWLVAGWGPPPVTP